MKLAQKIFQINNRINNTHQKILLVSLQKSGTHLISRVMDYLGFDVKETQICNKNQFKFVNKNQYYLSHFCPADDIQMALEEAGSKIKIIFNFRDPRDVAISWFHWIHPKNPKPMHNHMKFMQKVYSSFSDEQLMDFIIRIDKFRTAEYNPLEHFRHSRVLLFHPNVLNVKFEDLIGEEGGGFKKQQISAIQSIFNYLEVDKNYDAQECAKQLYSSTSKTFRKGKIGTHQSFFSKNQSNLFQKLHGDIVSQYGY